MTNKDAERLRRIHSFTQLIAYLRDELEWPFIEFDDPDQIAFDWSADELGIEGKHAAAIEEIRQLQPPEGDWPWGIFYVKFEKKRLPITVLRRALANVVRKKRATANTGQRWDLEDLLFISSYGEGDKRQISFARFQAPEEEGSRLPTLKVLAWDEDDTDLSLEHTAGELKSKLHWPHDTSNVEAWRSQWGSAFTRGHRETIEKSKDLAVALAGLAQRIRARITHAIALETQEGKLRKLMSAFQGSLVHDLDEDGFADMYAQTIAYGLFSARVTHPKGGDAGSLLSVPVTNPFLRELLATFLEVGGRKAGGVEIDFDELGVNDVVDLLDDTKMGAVLRDFGDKNPMEDPVIHFFEGFLGEYDPKIKKDRGVFYTPRPVVSFIVRSVDELLRTEFGLADGLADTTTWGEMASRIDDLEIPEGATESQAFVQILDPATGTGTFLVEVIDLIHKTMTAKWQAEGHGNKKIEELWNAYVPGHLLPRLHGYELMMAPYAIAHMKIGLKLYETGYRFESDERARVYLTNALEPAQDFSGTLAFAIPALAHEAEAVNAIKGDQRFTVVIGNPPYSVLSSNNGEWIQELLADFRQVDGKPLGERNSQSLQDDYVKFLRLVTNCIDESRVGVLGFITPHGFLDNPTFRGMRQQLARRFSKLRFLDLHGNVNKKEKCPDGSPDKNVFDILQGTAISILSKTVMEQEGDAAYAELWGDRGSKYQSLAANSVLTTSFTGASPQPPHFLLLPRDYGLYAGFSAWPPITELMPVWGNGLMTSRDNFVFGFSDAELLSRLRDFVESPLSEGRKRYGLRDVREMTIEDSQLELRRMADPAAHISPCLYRPLDVRPLFYHQCLVRWPAFSLMREMSGGQSLGLVTSRMTKGESFAHVMATRHPVEKIALSSKTSNNAFLFPLVVHPRDAGLSLFSGDRRPSVNLATKHMDEWFRRMGCSMVLAVDSDGSPNESSVRVFNYFFALLHSPSYRSQYAEFLRGEYPRLPLTGSLELFLALAKQGGELVGLHLIESPKLDHHISNLTGSGDFQVERVSFSDETVWIDKAKTRGFKSVPEEVWNFHIGGYQVCEKWLKDRQAKGGKNPRPGRVLTDEDIEHYQKIVVALSETIRIMAEIDEVIEAHGGWPGAFVTGSAESPDSPDLGGASLAAEGPSA